MVGVAKLGDSGSRFLIRLELKGQPRLQSLKGLTRAGGSSSMLAHSRLLVGGFTDLPHGHCHMAICVSSRGSG